MLKVVAPLSLWTSLGIYRGIQSYNYTYKTNYEEYEMFKDTYISFLVNKPQYYYTKCFQNGLYYGISYINPIILPNIIIKEMYRLEVNIRELDNKLDNKKDKSEYYKLF